MNDIKENRMDSLHEGALSLYRDKLSWGAWSKRFRVIMREYLILQKQIDIYCGKILSLQMAIKRVHIE